MAEHELACDSCGKSTVDVRYLKSRDSTGEIIDIGPFDRACAYIEKIGDPGESGLTEQSRPDNLVERIFTTIFCQSKSE